MILDAVLRKTALFEAEQLAIDLRQLGHRVSRATVYRTLAHLQDAGILKQVFFDKQAVILRSDRRPTALRLSDLRGDGAGHRIGQREAAQAVRGNLPAARV